MVWTPKFHTSQKWLFLEPSLFEMVVQPLKGKEQKQFCRNDAKYLLKS